MPSCPSLSGQPPLPPGACSAQSVVDQSPPGFRTISHSFFPPFVFFRIYVLLVCRPPSGLQFSFSPEMLPTFSPMMPPRGWSGGPIRPSLFPTSPIFTFPCPPPKRLGTFRPAYALALSFHFPNFPSPPPRLCDVFAGKRSIPPSFSPCIRTFFLTVRWPHAVTPRRPVLRDLFFAFFFSLLGRPFFLFPCRLLSAKTTRMSQPCEAGLGTSYFPPPRSAFFSAALHELSLD